MPQIYRIYVVWTEFRVIIFPCLLYLASLGESCATVTQCLYRTSSCITIALGILELYLSGKPDANFFVGNAARLGTAYWASTISLNIISSCFICGRLIYLGRALEAERSTNGSLRKDAVRYTGSLSIVVESAIPYSVAGFAFLVAFGLESDLSIMFGAFYGMFSVSLTRYSLYRHNFLHSHSSL